MKSLKTHLNEKSYGPQDTGLGKDEWKSKLKQHHPDVEFTNVSGKNHESHEAHIPWGKDKRRVGVWTNREKGGPHHSMDFARLATKEAFEILEQSDGYLKNRAEYHAGQALKAGKSGPNKLEGMHNMAAHHFTQALRAPSMDKRDYHVYKASSYADDAMEHQKSLQKEETVNELKSSTLKSYLKSNLKKTVEKDGQPNPPLFKLKARAKGMETAISKLMKKEAVMPIHPAVKAIASVPHTMYRATVTFNDGSSKNVSMKGTGGERNAHKHITSHYANKGIKVSNIEFTSNKVMPVVKEEAMAHSIGDQVRCTKTNRLATVTGAENDKYTVAYADGSTQTGDASYWAPIRKANESKTFRSIREAACRTPVYTSYYKGRKLHFCGSKGKSSSSRGGPASDSSADASDGNGGGGGGDGGGGGGV